MSSAIYVSMNKILEDNYEENSVCKKKNTAASMGLGNARLLQGRLFSRHRRGGYAPFQLNGGRSAACCPTKVMCDVRLKNVRHICAIDSDET